MYEIFSPENQISIWASLRSNYQFLEKHVKWHQEDTIIKIQTVETLQVKQPSLFHNLHCSGKKKRGGEPIN